MSKSSAMLEIGNSSSPENGALPASTATPAVVALGPPLTGSSKPSRVRRRRGRAMTYSSWGIACRPCARQSCKCLQYRLGPSSEGLRERASSYQSDNDPDFLRSANPAGKRSRICGGICAWRPSYGGRTHISGEENRRTERTTWVPRSVHTDAKCNGVMAAGNRRDQSRRAQGGTTELLLRVC